MEKTDLKNLTLPELTDFVSGINLAPFRARQIFSWLYREKISSFEQMTDIKKEVRSMLAELACFSRFAPEKLELSADGTVKFAFVLNDGAVIETVLIPDQGRNTLCVSSQVGCAMGCRFCLTGTMGLQRNLLPAEIVNQVAAAAEYLRSRQKGVVNNIVFMGMGEPLANYQHLLSALRILMEPRGFDFSDRRITVSTCGISSRIRQLGSDIRVNLAVSLHAADDETRSLLMPVNRLHGVDELLAACRDFPLPKRKRIMFEYVLIRDLNDKLSAAKLLAEKLKNIRCKINLLPYNETSALPYRRSTEKSTEEFQRVLWDAGYTVLLRSSRGADISAACGQLVTGR